MTTPSAITSGLTNPSVDSSGLEPPSAEFSSANLEEEEEEEEVGIVPAAFPSGDGDAFLGGAEGAGFLGCEGTTAAGAVFLG